MICDAQILYKRYNCIVANAPLEIRALGNVIEEEAENARGFFVIVAEDRLSVDWVNIYTSLA